MNIRISRFSEDCRRLGVVAIMSSRLAISNFSSRTCTFDYNCVVFVMSILYRNIGAIDIHTNNIT